MMPKHKNKKMKEMSKIIQDLYLKLIFNKGTFKRTQAKMMLELKNHNLTRKSKDTLWYRMEEKQKTNKQKKQTSMQGTEEALKNIKR